VREESLYIGLRHPELLRAEKRRYSGSMKTTLRLPDPLLVELRERSRQEGRSLNATAVDALWRGLGVEPADRELNAILGSFIAERATTTYEPRRVEERLAQLSDNARHLGEALEWTREDR
jgi:hypothetical protein